MTNLVTLRDLAKAAKVSHMTVSRALRNAPGINGQTRERILHVAARLGYRSNPFVSAWMANRRTVRKLECSSTIAFINSFQDQALWKRRASFTRFVQGARRRADTLGFQLEEFRLAGPGMSSQRLSEILYARGIQGVIVGSLAEANGQLQLEWDRFAAAAQGYSLNLPRLHCSCNNYFKTTLLALRELRLLGYRRIGFAMSAAVNARGGQLWTGAFAAYQQEIPAKMRISGFIPDSWTKTAFLKWFLKTRPDAILTCHVDIPGYLADAGIRVPEDVGVAQTDWHPEYAGWSGVDQNVEVAGANAVDLVAAQLLNNERGIPESPKVVLTDGAWVKGITTRVVGRPAPVRARSTLLQE